MAVSQRTATTATSGAAASASIVINTPTGTVAGDLMILQVGVDTGSSITITTLTGWTLLVRTNSTTVLGQAIYYRVADGTEGASFTWSLTSCQWSATLNSYPGADPFNPFANVTTLAKTSASTSATFTANKYQAENAYGVLLVTSRNVTGTTTISTPSTSYTTNGDTCTSASAFIQAAAMDQHAAYTIPLTSVAPGSATLSRSCTDMDSFVMIRPLVTGSSLGTDALSWNTGTSQTLACPAFSTGYGTEEVLIFAASASGTTPTISGGSLSYTLVKKQTGTGTNAYIWAATTTAPLSSVQITVDSGVGSSTQGILVVTFVSVDTTTGIGATASSSGLTGTPSSAATTTRGNSWVWFFNACGTNVAFTAGSNQTNVLDTSNGSQEFSVCRQNAVTAAKGTSVTGNGTLTSNFCAWITSEILIPPYFVGHDVQDIENTAGAVVNVAPQVMSSF